MKIPFYVYMAGPVFLSMSVVSSACLGASGEFDTFGSRVLGLADVAREGQVLVASAPGPFGDFEKTRGAVFVYPGQEASPVMLTGEVCGDLFGWSLVDVADQDDDGVREIIITAPQGELDSGEPGPGYAILVQSQDWLVVRRLDGLACGDMFGYSSCALRSSTTGDSEAKLVAIGAPEARWRWKARDEYESKGPGYVAIVTIPDLAVKRRIRGTRTGDLFGASLAELDDLDGDGVLDLGVGSPGAKNDCPARGKVSIVSGQTGEILREHCGDVDDTFFGVSICCLNDVDGDSIRDYAVSGVTVRSLARIQHGHVRVFSGRGGGVLCTIDSPSPSMNKFGWTITSWGTDNTDSLIAVGAPTDQTSHLEQGGEVYLFRSTGELQKTLGLDRKSCVGAPEHGVCGPRYFGSALAMLPDTDGDGLCELTVGAPDAFVGGRVFVIGTESLTIIRRVDGPEW